jgi:nitrilase
MAKLLYSFATILRLPELYRAMAKSIVPPAFTETTGKAHWELNPCALLKTCAMIALRKAATIYPARETHGNSMIVDPWA